jgi:hypothetical protein
MVNKQLADWIKSEEAQGYSEKQLRDYLLKQGYNSKDVDDAIKSFGQKEITTPFSAKAVFKPTILKCFFPVLILVLIFVSFFINSAHISPVVDYFCDTLNNVEELKDFNEQVREKSLANNADPQELINLYQQEENLRKQSFSSRNVLAEHLNPLITGNLYFTVSMIYKLNPFLPTPCEALTLGEGFTNTNFCRYYMSEESYNCINNYIIKQKQESNAGAAIIGLFSSDLPTYKKISFLSLLIHGIILISILYTIIALISFGRTKLSAQNKKNKLIINGSLIVLPILIFFIFDFAYLLFLLPLIIVFVISSFIKNEKHNQIFLYVITAILILLLIGGIFVTNFIVNRNVLGSTMDTSSIETNMEYKIFPCENTKILSMEEKQQFGLDEKYINEEWNVCDNPTCSDICRDYCNQKQSYGRRIGMLRGDIPSCICGC